MTNFEDIHTCIIGLGPAGLGAAIVFSHSLLSQRVLCLEVGVSLEERICLILQNSTCKRAEPCQMITGVGGCSLLAGGKVSVFPAGGGLKAIMEKGTSYTEQKLLEALELFKTYVPLQPYSFSIQNIEEWEQHFRKLGFDYRFYESHLFGKEDLLNGYLSMLSQLKNSGISLLLRTQAVHIEAIGPAFRIIAMQDNKEVGISAKNVILAVGRWGTSLLKSLEKAIGLYSLSNHLDVGIRLEFPTNLWPDIDASHNDLKLLFGQARTFCVCKDGKIAPYRLGNVFFTEGYRDLKERTGFTNLAVTMRLKPAYENERIFEEIKTRVIAIGKGFSVRQTLPEYLGLSTTNSVQKNKEPSISFWTWGDVNHCFPSQLSYELCEAVHYFASRIFPEEAWSSVDVFAPEVDYYWPKFKVKSDFSSSFPGLYLVGDCTGHFRGILQAFCSGIVCAESILDRNHA